MAKFIFRRFMQNMRIDFAKIKAPCVQKAVKLSTEQLKTLRYLPDEFLPAQKIGSYEDFLKKIRTVYGKIGLKRLIKKCKNYELGYGNYSRVYGIPGVDDYVLKVNHKTKLGLFNKVPPLEKLKNDLYAYNFGQKIATNRHGVSVLLKTEGKPYSLPNWIDFYNSAETEGNYRIKNIDAEYFLNENLSRVAKFPQESFDRFAKKVYFLQKVANRYIDFYNPNNLLVDYRNKEFNIIDVGSAAGYPVPFHFYRDMVSPFVDSYFKNDILKALSPDKFAEFFRYEDMIVEKCRKAALKCGLAK